MTHVLYCDYSRDIRKPFGTHPDSSIEVESGDVFDKGNCSIISTKQKNTFKTSEVTYVYKVIMMYIYLFEMQYKLSVKLIICKHKSGFNTSYFSD
jgi:hypothetical protein